VTKAAAGAAGADMCEQCVTCVLTVSVVALPASGSALTTGREPSPLLQHGLNTLLRSTPPLTSDFQKHTHAYTQSLPPSSPPPPTHTCCFLVSCVCKALPPPHPTPGLSPDHDAAEVDCCESKGEQEELRVRHGLEAKVEASGRGKHQEVHVKHVG